MFTQNWQLGRLDAHNLRADAELADDACARRNAPSVVLGQIGFELLVTLSLAVAVNAALVFYHIG